MWPFSRRLEDVLDQTKSVRVHGVKFLIKKIDTTNFLDGSKVMLKMYDIYKVKGSALPEDQTEKNLLKVKEHYRDVFMASIVSPKLTRKNEGMGIFVDNIFTEWDLANELYSEIMLYTYGKKKLIQDTLSAAI